MTRYYILLAAWTLPVFGVCFYYGGRAGRAEQSAALWKSQSDEQSQKLIAVRSQLTECLHKSIQELKDFNRMLEDSNRRLKDDTKELRESAAALAARNELLRLRAEVARLEDMDIGLSGLTPAATRERWKRVHQLQARLEDTPVAHVPELALARAEDLFAACPDPLVTDMDYWAALSRMRTAWEGKLVPLMSAAMKVFVATNSGQFPTNVAQLAPCFDPPVSPSLLARWWIYTGKDDAVTQLIVQRTIDPEFDKIWMITKTGRHFVMKPQKQDEKSATSGVGSEELRE